MIYLWAILTGVILILCYVLLRDFLNPAFILGIVWFAVYIMLIFTQPETLTHSPIYGIFMGAFFSFLIGFILSKPKKTIYRTCIHYLIEWNNVSKNLILGTTYIFSIIWLITALGYLGSGNSIWTSFRTGLTDNNILSSTISVIMQDMILVLGLVALGIYLCNPIKKNRNAFLFSLFPLSLVLLLSPRGTWFMMIIAAVLMIIIIRRPSNKTILISGIFGVGIIFAIFIISSYDKFSNAWTYWSAEEKMDYFISAYFLSPPINFINWLTSGYELEGGKYLFRFFCAVLNTIGFDLEVVATVQDFVQFNNYSSNVYTALHWYAIDFGWPFIFVVELFLGFFYGKIYRRVRNEKCPTLFAIILFSMLIFPVVNQFFDEKIFSILSNWIQRMLWLLLFTKTNIFIREKSKAIALCKQKKEN